MALGQPPVVRNLKRHRPSDSGDVADDPEARLRGMAMEGLKDGALQTLLDGEWQGSDNLFSVDKNVVEYSRDGEVVSGTMVLCSNLDVVLVSGSLTYSGYMFIEDAVIEWRNGKRWSKLVKYGRASCLH